MAKNSSKSGSSHLHNHSGNNGGHLHDHSGNWYATRGDERLHYRVFFPECQPKALIFFVHGYGGNCNIFDKVDFFENVMACGYAVVAPDLFGHGYSDGSEFQCQDFRHYVDDVSYLLSFVMGDVILSGELGTFNIPAENKSTLASLPIFLSGESLGGLIAILVGLELQEKLERNSVNFKRFCGVCLFAPCLEVAGPPAPIVAVLKVFAKYFPSLRIPTIFQGGLKKSQAIWKEEVLIEYPERRNREAISIMCFETALQILTAVDHLRSREKEVKFSIFILMDPNDKVVTFSAVEHFLCNCSTPETNKNLLRLEGALHDIIANDLKRSTEEIDNWCTSRLDATRNCNGA